MNQATAIKGNSSLSQSNINITHIREPLRLIGIKPHNNCDISVRNNIKHKPFDEERSDFDIIKPFSSVRKLDKNEMLFNEGDEVIHFYEIIFGHLKTYTLLSDGRRHITNFLRKGDVIGLTQEEKHRFSAQAITRADVRRHSFSEMNEVIQKSPSLANKVLMITQKELKNARAQMVLLGRKTPEEKVASFLLNCESSPAGGSNDESLLYIPMSLVDIADHLGMAQETICRVLGKYKRNGLLKYQSLRKRREIYVSSLKSLSHFADMVEY